MSLLELISQIPVPFAVSLSTCHYYVFVTVRRVLLCPRKSTTEVRVLFRVKNICSIVAVI